MSTYKEWARKQGWKHRLKTKTTYWTSRWPLADAVNHLDRTCWSDLVNWALYEPEGDPEEDDNHKLRYSLSGGERCRKESSDPAILTCYCGKFTNGCRTAKGRLPGDIS